MSDGLLICDHCGCAPKYIANRFEAVIICSGCGMSTPPQSLDQGGETAFQVLSGIWNSRFRPSPTESHELAPLINKELTTSDLGTVLSLIARNQDDWADRGPLFAAMAGKLLQPQDAIQDLMPAETMLRDAGRYRKIARRARVKHVDGRPWIYIEPLDAMGAEIAEELSEATSTIEVLLSNALDGVSENDDDFSLPFGSGYRP